MGPTVCTETSVRIYHSTLRKIPKRDQNLFNIIRSMYYEYNQLHTPTNAHNSYKIANHPYT